MKTTYSVVVDTVCPVNGEHVAISLEFHCNRSKMIYVEDIQQTLATLTAAPITQENLTARLCEVLKTADSIVSTGTHGGVAIRCEA